MMGDAFLKDFADLCARYNLRLDRVTFEGTTGPDGPRPTLRFAARYVILDDGRVLPTDIASLSPLDDFL